MQTLDGEIYGYLRSAAGVRGVTIQGLIRAVIIPNWVGDQQQKLGLVERNQSVLQESGDRPLPGVGPVRRVRRLLILYEQLLG